MPMGAEMLSLLAMSIAGDWWPGRWPASWSPRCLRRFVRWGFWRPAAGSTRPPPESSRRCSIFRSPGPERLVGGADRRRLGLLPVLGVLRCAAVEVPSFAGRARVWAAAGRPAVFCWPAILPAPPRPRSIPVSCMCSCPWPAWVRFGAGGTGDEKGQRQNLKSQISNLKSQISNLKSQISNLKSRSVVSLVADRHLKRRLAPLFALVVFFRGRAGCGLWFGKNWTLTGNPTYPLFYGVLDGKTWNAEKDSRWNRVHRPHDFSLPKRSSPTPAE